MKAVQLKKLSNIIKISANCNHYLALERADLDPLCKWSPEKVASWFASFGFGDCSNIIKYNKINGEQIMQADNDFLQDTLGIMGEVEQDKLRFEIGLVREGSIGECKLYGWGNNKWG